MFLFFFQATKNKGKRRTSGAEDCAIHQSMWSRYVAEEVKTPRRETGRASSSSQPNQTSSPPTKANNNNESTRLGNGSGWAERAYRELWWRERALRYVFFNIFRHSLLLTTFIGLIYKIMASNGRRQRNRATTNTSKPHTTSTCQNGLETRRMATTTANAGQWRPSQANEGEWWDNGGPGMFFFDFNYSFY